MMTVTETRINKEKTEDLKKYLVPYVESITEKSKRAGKGQYVCPLCGSGTGQHGTGAFTVYEDTNSWYCYSCGQSGDIYKLVELHEGISGDDRFPERVEFVERFAGLPFISEPTTKKYKDNMYTQNTEITEEQRQRFIRERRDMIDRCTAAVSQTDYFAKRGFTEKEVRKYRLGYNPRYNRRPGIIIPYNDADEYFIVRHTDEKDPKYSAPLSKEAGGRRVYNKRALAEGKPCFVCEGELNAISIDAVAAGSCNAVAYGGTGGVDIFLKEVQNNKPGCTLIICTDPDEAGQKAGQKIAKGLDEIGVPYVFAKFTTEAYPVNMRKDPNDFLIGNKAQFLKDIGQNIEAALYVNAPELNNVSEEYKEYAAFIEEHNGKNASELLKNFIDGISSNADTPFIPTGFDKLDTELDGGLYPGLYIMGAVSSLGKTTLLLQIADQIAELTKQEVVFFSLEMSANELISKSLSRLTHQHCYENDRNAKTARGISTASRYEKYSKEEVALIQTAIKHYKTYADRIYIYEGMGDIGVNTIREIVKKHKETSVTGKAPVVMIDYLQILAPNDVRASDKQNTDKAVLELKRISRDFNMPVIAVSSFNRENYEDEVTFNAFKESGAIEYGSDVLIGLYPQGMTRKKDTNRAVMKRSKQSTERKVVLEILKNRNGRTGGRIGFKYLTLFNRFIIDYNYNPDEADE